MVIPKATVYRQLGSTYDEAIRKLPVVHAEIEALFDQERSAPNSLRARSIVGSAWANGMQGCLQTGLLNRNGT